MSEDLYKVLGVSRDAGADDIRRAYRRLAKTCHPDTHPGDKKAEEKFKKISAAYAILGDKEKRARYDRGEIDAEGNERAPQGGFWQHARSGAGGGPRGTHYEFRTGPGAGFGDVDDIISELFGGRRGGGRRSRHGAHAGGFRAGGFEAGGFRPGGFAGEGPFEAGDFAGRGQDARYQVSVDFLEAAKGAKKRITLPDGRSLEVNIPAGIEDGQSLRLKGQGQPGAGGGPAGDALVEVKVASHPTFSRDGLDIHVEQPVPLHVAVLGGKVRVPTIAGEVSLNVPKGTSSGRTLRLRGRGIHDKKSGKKGDQLVKLLITLPETIDSDLEAAARKLAAADTSMASSVAS